MATRWFIAGLFALAVGVCAAAAPDSPVASPSWQALSPAQQKILAPLERDWASVDAQRRAKWLEVAARYPTMPVEEQARLQARMSDWARMTPAERGRARLQFQETRQVPLDERQAKWQAYQALSDDERRVLAQRAKRNGNGKATSTPAAAASAAVAGPATATSTGATAQAESGKRNLVQTTPSPRAKATTPTTQQARPGATTTTMTTKPQPPAHHQAGLPKIAATPGFVNPSTLLPQRGPQGAAVRSASAASEPAAQP